MKQIVTVFTSTYNRASFLPRAYVALKNQSCKNFIWMIIDDGSTDDTEQVVEGFINEEKEFKIQYIKKENGGLHTGYNTAIEHATTELMFNIDSDDWIAEDVIEKIVSFWIEQPDRENFAGIVGLACYEDGTIIGRKFPNQNSINFIDRFIGPDAKAYGDCAPVIRTDLFREVAPMKCFDGEKNFNPNWMILEISRKYDFLVLNERLKYVEYQSCGMSASIFKQYLNSPNSFAEIRKQYLSFEGSSLKFKIRHTIHYISSCILAKKSAYETIMGTGMPGLCILCIPAGWLLSIYIKLRVKFDLDLKVKVSKS